MTGIILHLIFSSGILNSAEQKTKDMVEKIPEFGEIIPDEIRKVVKV